MNSIKRIAMISFHTCPLASQEGKESGGMNVFVLELAKELAKKGIQIDVFTRMQDETSANIVNVVDNLRVIHLKAGTCSNLPKKQLIQFIPEFSHSLHDFIRKEGAVYDVLHAHYYMSGMVGIRLIDAYKMRLPLITTFHTLALMKNLVARDENEREEELRVNAEFELIRRSDIVTASSTTDKDYLMSLYDCPAEKLKVVTPGVDTKLFYRIDKKDAASHLHENADQKIILFVGRIEPLKGIDVLMYALKIYLHRNPDSNIKLMIVGGSDHQSIQSANSELHRLKLLQHTLKIHPSVEFIPQQPQPELPYYYNYADIVVMPSHYESFGMTSLEAMACGTSIITTDTSGISSIIDEELRDLVISANNPMLLATQIESVLGNPEKHDRLQKKVMKTVRTMTWNHVAENMINIYEKTVRHVSNI